jgi:hypothetical protein
MLKISVLLFAVNALVALAMGLRYLGRADLLPYQSKATGRTISDLDPALRVVVLAMIRVVGGGFLSFGVLALGLTACLWRGELVAGYALTLGAAALLGPAWFAASSIGKYAPDSGAPTGLTLAAGGIAALAFLALLAS